MRNDRVFSAPSLSEVLKQLLIHRPTGLLTIQRITDSRQEEAHIAIERGRPTHILHDRHEEEANEASLAWLDTWGQIRFTFQTAEPLLQLPPPASPPLPERPTTRELRAQVSLPKRPAPTTRPLPALPPTPQFNSAPSSGPLAGPRWPPMPDTASQNGRGQAGNADPGQGIASSQDVHGLPLATPELVVPSITMTGKEQPVARIPRYDRVVFLLLNSRRTVADLIQLTKRPVADLYASLYRLQNQKLIIIETYAQHSKDQEKDFPH
ncbi:MAG: hypothetical protein M3Z08_21890 [Chloroflexota bacterium]|nr:hypothetical protein [Chloroflexota bacterium]